MNEIKGLYSSNRKYCLIQMGRYANSVRAQYELKIGLADTPEKLAEIGWMKISSKHLAVWDE